MFMGDDALEPWFEDAINEYLRVGKRIKFFERIDDGTFQFCSRSFDVDARDLVPESKYKMLATLLNTNEPMRERMEKVAAYRHEARFMPDLDQDLLLLEAIGFT
jgi:hypothetical protein